MKQRPKLKSPQIGEVGGPPKETKADERAIDDFYQSIDEDDKRQSHNRRQIRKKVLQWLILGIIVVLVIGAGVVFSIRLWHVIAREDLCWLKDARLDQIDSFAKFAFTGALGGLLTKFVENNVTN